MTTPTLWIFLPFGLAVFLLLIRDQKANALVSSILAFILALAAWLLPIDTALSLGNWSFKFSSSFTILGRHLILASTDRSLLAFIYGSAVFWFASSLAVKTPRRQVPLELAIISLLVAALAVEPFLYSALLIEMAVLISIPLLSTSGQRPGKGLIRFLIFQTLAMPFILFSGWLLAGIEANPGNLSLVSQAAVLIGLGFALLLGVFPFHSWIPMLTEEASPLAVGFILWLFPTVTLFFGVGFLDRYTWLRDAPILGTTLTTVGLLMVVSGGILTTYQRHLGRIMAYAVIIETGISLIAISQATGAGLGNFYLLLVPRVLCWLVWGFSLAILKEHYPSLDLDDMKGIGHVWPFAVTGLVLANLISAGMPLLAGFPAHLPVWERLALTSLPLAGWLMFGTLGLFISAMRMLAGLLDIRAETNWGSRETGGQRVLLLIGFLGIFLLGLFPQWMLLLWNNLPAIFTHLAR